MEAEPEMVGSYAEPGIVYACREQYRMMVEALRQAVASGPSGVRASLGGQPLGDGPDAPKPTIYRHTRRGGEGQSDAVIPLVAAMSCWAEGPAAVVAARATHSPY